MRIDALRRTLAAACFGASLLVAASATAQKSEDLSGIWMLVSSVTEKDGHKTEQFGPGAKGMMSLDAGGHFMLTIIAPDLPKFSSGNRANATSDESKAVVGGSIAMIGRYSVDLSTQTLVFNVESATFPNWNGTAQKRLIVTARGEELKYVTPTASSGGVGTVTWKRAH